MAVFINFMTQLAQDQNEFDKVVKHKVYRWTFLHKFEDGWKIIDTGHINSFDIEKTLKNFLELITKNEFSIIESERIEQFGVWLGLLINVFRDTTNRTISKFGNVSFCSDIIVRIIVL